tara:strand:+ start:2655 stop:2888 length:234 start_codon:yes stop_codon:yes gene_type:complete
MEEKLVALYARITPELHAMLQKAAKKDRRSMASLIELLCRESLRRREPGSINYTAPDNTLHDVEVSDAVERMVQASE